MTDVVRPSPDELDTTAMKTDVVESSLVLFILASSDVLSDEIEVLIVLYTMKSVLVLDFLFLVSRFSPDDDGEVDSVTSVMTVLDFVL